MWYHKNMKIAQGDGVQWIDIERPTDKDIAWLGKEFGIHPVILQELKAPSVRGHVESYKDYLFFIYYFPRYDKDDEASVRAEIDFIVTKHAVITVHYEAIYDILNKFDVAAYDSSLMLMYRIVQNLIAFQERQLRHIREKVEAVGREIFHDKEKEVLEQITYVKRDVSEYRIIVRLQEPILHSLLLNGRTFWGKNAEVYLNDLLGDHLKVVSQIDDYREAIADFEDTNNQLMNMKTTSVMKTFTSLSFLTFPFMLLAAIFSMNIPGTPFMNMPGAFWIVTGVIIAGIIALAIYFRKKGWL